MRPLKILHVGNIANNAYNNAKLLIERGHICHVACYDFYHFAACAEWQELTTDIDRDQLGDQHFPNFWRLGADRPEVPWWFAQGPQARVLTYLGYLATGQQRLASLSWGCLRYGRFKVTIARDPMADRLPWTEEVFQRAIAGLKLTDRDRAELAVGRAGERIAQQIYLALRCTNSDVGAESVTLPIERSWLETLGLRNPRLRQSLDELPPGGVLCAIGVESDPAHVVDRAKPPRAKQQDAAIYQWRLPAWRWLFRQYDIVMCYGPDPILGYLANDRPYIAYEHGTLRDIPFEDTPQGRLVNLAYTNAATVLVTNNDYLIQPRKLDIPPNRLVCLPHAFDERPLRHFAAQHGRKLPEIVTFLGPARQDWVQQYPTMTKNNHYVVHAARRLKDQGLTNFRTRFVEWGVDVAATKGLITELGVQDHFVWVPPMNKRALWGNYLDAHAVIDQFLLPSISGVSFEALALGCRVITRDDGIANRLAFGEQPPFLSADDVDSVTERMRQVIADPEDKAGIGRAAWEWVDRCHSAHVIVERQEAVFAKFVA